MTVDAVRLPALPRRDPGASLATFGPIAVLTDPRRRRPRPAPLLDWGADLLRSVATDIRRQDHNAFHTSHEMAAAGAELVRLIDAQLPTAVRLAALPPHTTARQLGALVEISLHAAAAELAGEVAGAAVLDEDIRSHVAYGLGDAIAIAWPQGVTCIDHAVQLTRERRLPTLLGLDNDTDDIYGQLIFTDTTMTCPFCSHLAADT
jgi:hypothetical protein